VGYALESGLLEEEEALHHDQRHLISNMVGSAEMRIEVGSPIRLAPRDTVLLATDGLLDNLSLQEIVDGIRAGPLARVVRNLARTCGRRMREPEGNYPSKPDDLSFLLFRLT
jgi:serine/threonine protein phosphatase PrpC